MLQSMPLTGLGIIAGTALGMLIAVVSGIQLAAGIAAGASVGLILGAALEMRTAGRSTDVIS